MEVKDSLMQAPRRSRRLAARLWWALLPHAGILGWPRGVGNPPRWCDYPLAWLWKLVDRLPSSAPFEPYVAPVCNCDWCRGVPGAVFEP